MRADEVDDERPEHGDHGDEPWERESAPGHGREAGVRERIVGIVQHVHESRGQGNTPATNVLASTNRPPVQEDEDGTAPSGGGRAGSRRRSHRR